MTSSTTTHSHPTGKKNSRPTLVRQMAAKYVDVLAAGFISWTLCSTIGSWRPYWLEASLFLFFSQWLWFRDQLIPTVGEYFLGIRYLTSSSSQVVADIKIIQAKFKLNPYLLIAGVGDLTLALFLFSGWTFLPNAVAFGFSFDPPLSVAYWALAGLALFVCAGYILGGSKLSFFVVPIVHGLLWADLFLSHPQWSVILQQTATLAAFPLLKELPLPFFESFGAWTLCVVATLALSRKHLVNP